MTSSPSPWYTDDTNKAELVRWLIARGEIKDTADAANYVWEKPHKYTPEYRVMRQEQARTSALENAA